MLYTMRVRKQIYYDVTVEAESVKQATIAANKQVSRIDHKHWTLEGNKQKTTIHKMQ